MVELSANSVEDVPVPFENMSKQVLLLLSLVILIDDVLVELPVNGPKKLPIKNVVESVPEFGMYDKFGDELSTNNVEFDDTVLANGIKQVVLLLSLVNDIDDADDALPDKLPVILLVTFKLPFTVVVELSSKPIIAFVTAFWLLIVFVVNI